MQRGCARLVFYPLLLIAVLLIANSALHLSLVSSLLSQLERAAHTRSGSLMLSVAMPGASHPHTTSFSLFPNRASARSRAGDDVRGQPTISAAFIDRVLSAYHSPAVGIGQEMYDLGVQYGIDPVYALAFFKHESTFGLYGVSRFTNSIGNIRCTEGYACIQGYRAYATRRDGIEDFYRLLVNAYIPQGRTTVHTIIPMYAPTSDGNDEQAYIAAVLTDVARWRAGEVA